MGVQHLERVAEVWDEAVPDRAPQTYPASQVKVQSRGQSQSHDLHGRAANNEFERILCNTYCVPHLYTFCGELSVESQLCNRIHLADKMLNGPFAPSAIPAHTDVDDTV